MMRLDEFCRRTGEIVSARPEADVPGVIAEFLPELLACPDLLRDDQKRLPAEGYGRHEVFLCPNDLFSVIAAVWPPRYASPIHNHMTWCAFGVLEGEVRETRYLPESADPACRDAVVTAEQLWTPGATAHLPVTGNRDIHCMYNPGSTPAISVHVYGGNAAKLGPNVVNIYREAAAAPA